MVNEYTNNINSATSSNMSTNVTDVTVATKQTNETGITIQNDEIIYQNTKWTQQYGYYLQIPELKTAIDTRCIWTVGKKYNTDTKTQVILDHITGWGQDTFQTILQNGVAVKRVGGDFFAEIMRDEDSGTLINLKPLDPSTMRIVCDLKGTLLRYEQVSKYTGKITKFKPEEIFHLMNKRIADSIHGVSDIDAVENIILASNENFTDVKKLFHRFVKPICKFSIDTDDTTKINTLIAKYDQIVEKGENLFIPKDTMEHELITVPSSATLSPFQWIDHLKNYFYQVVGIPQIILGSASEFSESSAKIAYLSFLQSLEEEQLYIENQVWNQLYLKIELDLPATLRNEMISDEEKDGANAGVGFQQNDMTLSPTNQEGGI